MNIYQTLIATAKKYPNHTAVIIDNKKLSYDELYKKCELLREKLREEGVGKGDIIALHTRNSPSFIIGLYGAISTGAVVMPIYNQLSTTEVASSLKEASITYILTDDPSWKYKPKSLTTDIYGAVIESKEKSDFSQLTDNPCFIRFTSGTTGKAKGVVLSHESVLERTAAANEILQISNHDVVTWVLPMAYHFVVSICLYIREGATILINNDFDAEHLIKDMDTHQATFLYAAPMHLKLLNNYKQGKPVNSLKTVISTTTALSEQVCKGFSAKYKIDVTQAFGIIEVGLPIINTRTVNPTAIGYTLPAYESAILNEHYEEITDSEGLLALKGPGMFCGYLNPTTKIDQILKNGWFITGDLAKKDADGLITIVGRAKNVINVAGNKVFPEEVEQVLLKHPSVEQCIVYNFEHRILGEIVAAKLIVKEGMEVEQEQIITFCRKHLANFKVPQFISFVKEIETTGSGKIKRYDFS